MPFLSGLLASIAERGRAMIRRKDEASPSILLPAPGARSLIDLCQTLLEQHGEASRVKLAVEILARWRGLKDSGKRDFLVALAEGFGPDAVRLSGAIDAYLAKPGAETCAELHEAAEPRRQEILRRLNLAPLGTISLVRMREEAFKHMAQYPVLNALDSDFVHLFLSWFNRGFLVLRQIDWTTPANILEKIIRYEAVHQIRDWNDLRNRLEPADRRCFAFFHPALIDEPLIFVEVALAPSIADNIGGLLAEERTAIEADKATTAVFYSISNCQDGLRGISFGDFLIKQVVEELCRELPDLSTFVTLSPAPGFGRWLARERAKGEDSALTAAQIEALAGLDQPGWTENGRARKALKPVVMSAAASFLLTAKGKGGKPMDPVSRFHLGNGARLERINWLANVSARGLEESHGVMVNYLYDLPWIESNHEAYERDGRVIHSAEVEALLPAQAVIELAPAAKPKGLSGFARLTRRSQG